MLEKKLNIKQIHEISNILNLFTFIIENSTENPTVKSKFESALMFLAIAQKGLTQR